MADKGLEAVRWWQRRKAIRISGWFLQTVFRRFDSLSVVIALLLFTVWQAEQMFSMFGGRPPGWVHAMSVTFGGLAGAGSLVATAGVVAHSLFAAGAKEQTWRQISPVKRLDSQLSLEPSAHTFQAEHVSWERRGTVLSIRCTNMSPNDSLENCRARLEEITQQQDDGSWVTPPNSGFTPHWLTWDREENVATLAPTDWAACLVVAHDSEIASFVHLLGFTTKLPWVVADGRWRVTVTWRADDHLPISRQFEFLSEGNNEGPTHQPPPARILRWME